MRGITLQAAVGACAALAVVYTWLTGLLLGVVERLRTGIQTQAFIEVTRLPKLIGVTARTVGRSLIHTRGTGVITQVTPAT